MRAGQSALIALWRQKFVTSRCCGMLVRLRNDEEGFAVYPYVMRNSECVH